METLSPAKLAVIGAVLALVGWMAPLLMILRVVEPSFGLCFVSYGLVVAGMTAAAVGALQHVRVRERD